MLLCNENSLFIRAIVNTYKLNAAKKKHVGNVPNKSPKTVLRFDNVGIH